jgi:hypothetical protein
MNNIERPYGQIARYETIQANLQQVEGQLRRALLNIVLQ